jgi:hypothetical protein
MTMAVTAWAGAANAESVVRATCGPFTGVSHVVQGAGVNNVQVGGEVADMAGETKLTFDGARPDQPYDVVHEGGDGTKSLTSSGARAIAAETEDGVVVSAIYPNGVVETFHFVGAVLIYGQSEHRDGLVATSTYAADCTWVN